MKFSGKMWLVIVLKVTKKQGFTFSLEYTLIFGETAKWGGEWGGGGTLLANYDLNQNSTIAHQRR